MAKAQNKTDSGKPTKSEENSLNIHYVPRSERYEMGKQMRKKCPRSSHANGNPQTGTILLI